MRGLTTLLAAGVTVAVLLVFMGEDVTAGGKSRSRFRSQVCDQTAQLAALACGHQAYSDYYVAVAKCGEVMDPDGVRECTQDARAELAEAIVLCRQQRTARRELCDELGGGPYDLEIDPANFVVTIDNPYLPLNPGTTRVYEGETEEGLERIEVAVTSETREILGVECVVVRDTVTLDGDVIEDTFDWYAQDLAGNVWYFGELSYEIEEGVIVSLAGSWEAGVDGAKPGIVMPATPVVGEVYRQEFLLAEAEDIARVVSTDEQVEIEYGSFAGCLQTEDFTPLEPDVLEYKFYAPGIGLVLEENPQDGTAVELVEVTGP